MSTPVPKKPFKVIVIGAGVTGLTLSHALNKAKIEHVVLERGDIAPLQGSSIGIHPHGCRILDQLGCLQDVERLCVPMKQFVNRLPNGQLLSRSDFFDFIAKRNGYDFLNVERRAFLQTMSDCLPKNALVKTQQRISRIIQDDEGIRVVLADGTVEKGDIVVGCDGVNSIVRNAIWAHANEAVPNYITSTEKRTLQTTYNCLLGIAPTPAGLGTRDMTCVNEHGLSFLFLSQPKQIYFFVFSKMPKQTGGPYQQRWTKRDAEEVADKVKDHPVSDSLLFGELWRTRIRGQLVSIEEGVFKHWYSGRMVLAGDAVHKVTPNFALGGNTGMESVAVLTNELYCLLETTSQGRPTEHAITSAFQRYQIQRVPRVRKIHFLSGLITRLQAWDGILMRCMARWIVPLLIGDERIADQLAYLIKDSPKLDFVESMSRKGTIAWSDEKLRSDPEYRGSEAFDIRRLLALAAASALIMTCIYWRWGIVSSEGIT